VPWGGDIRGVQLAEYLKHNVGVCDDGMKSGVLMIGLMEERVVEISWELNSQLVAKIMWASADKAGSQSFLIQIPIGSE